MALRLLEVMLRIQIDIYDVKTRKKYQIQL